MRARSTQKTEILKQLYLKRRFMILDEPTSVLTPKETDEVLEMRRDMLRPPCLDSVTAAEIAAGSGPAGR